jgi:hypothetical protein
MFEKEDFEDLDLTMIPSTARTNWDNPINKMSAAALFFKNLKYVGLSWYILQI